MNQYMPGDTGYTDKGKADHCWPHVPADPPAVAEVIRQGRENPRPLSLEESRLAAANRSEDSETRRQMEAWYEAQCS